MNNENIEIKIAERIYNGKVTEGKIIKKEYVFKSNNSENTLEIIEIKYPNVEISKMENIEVNIEELIELLSKLNNEYIYDEAINKGRNIPERLRYTDIYFNGIHMELSNDSELLIELKKCINI